MLHAMNSDPPTKKKERNQVAQYKNKYSFFSLTPTKALATLLVTQACTHCDFFLIYATLDCKLLKGRDHFVYLCNSHVI